MGALKELSNDTSVFQYFINQEGALTATPWKDPLKSKNGARLKYADLGESQQEIVRQNKAYVENFPKVKRQQTFLSGFFHDICNNWYSAINRDFEENPLSEKEKALLGENNKEKAYGCTLLAYLRTPLFWLAFQIGDGKILICDRDLRWTEPVPWDCRCFLNLTTSLCDSSHPWDEFRFAFNGNGFFPIGVYLGSDGVDDSWGTPDKLKNFYSQVTQILVESDDLIKSQSELLEYLKELSIKASHDDISIASTLYLSELVNGVHLYKLRRDGRNIQEQIVSLEKKLKESSDNLSSPSIWESITAKYKQWLQSLHANLEGKDVSTEETLNEFLESSDQLSKSTKEHQDLFLKVKDKIVELKEKLEVLKQEHSKIENENRELSIIDIKKWRDTQDAFIQYASREYTDNTQISAEFGKNQTSESLIEELKNNENT
jgi:hypothetical protein